MQLEVSAVLQLEEKVSSSCQVGILFLHNFIVLVSPNIPHVWIQKKTLSGQISSPIFLSYHPLSDFCRMEEEYGQPGNGKKCANISHLLLLSCFVLF